MKKQIICEKCGKEIDEIDAFYREGHTYCIDCLNPLVCNRCGKTISHSEEVSRIKHGKFCQKCLFPENDFLRFKSEYEEYCCAIDKINSKTNLKILLVIIVQLAVLFLGGFLSYLIYEEVIFYSFDSGAERQFFVSLFVSFVIWLIITIKIASMFKKKEKITFSDFYDFKNPDGECITLSDLYSKFFDKKPLGVKRTKMLVNDFLSKAELTVEQGNAGQYQISGQFWKKELNGFLVIDKATDEILEFKVFQAHSDNYIISITDQCEIWNLHCVVNCLEKGNTGKRYKNSELSGQLYATITCDSKVIPTLKNKKSLKKTYEKLGNSSLSNRELESIIKHFVGISKQYIITQNKEYSLAFNSNTHSSEVVNGILAISANDKKVYLFKVNQPIGSLMKYTFKKNMQVYFYNCDIQPIATEEKEIVPTINDNTPKRQENGVTIDEKIEKIEKLNQMKKSGMLSQEEFDKLKKELF